MWWNPKTWFKSKVEEQIRELRDAIAALCEHIGQEKTTSAQEIQPGDSILLRLEAVERRMEEVHADCMDYLRKGKTAATRAEKLQRRAMGDEDEEGAEGRPEELEGQLGLFGGRGNGENYTRAGDLSDIRQRIAKGV